MSEENYTDRMIREKEARQYAIYKGMKGKFGAMRFKLKPAYSLDISKPEGIIFLEAAPAVGNNNYDWDGQKITFAISVTDAGQILHFLKAYTAKTYVKEDGSSLLYLVHDGSSRKKLPTGTILTDINVSKSPAYDSFFWKFNYKNKEDGKVIQINIPVSLSETMIISTLLEKAIPEMLSW